MVSDLGTQGLAKLFGPTADYALNQLPKAMKALKQEDNPVAAFEIAGPRFTRGPLKALRSVNQSIEESGGLKNYQGRVVLPDVRVGEAGVMALGGTPARLQRENEIISNEFQILARSKNKPKDYNKLIADTYGLKDGVVYVKDPDRLKSLLNEIRDHNAGLLSLPMDQRLTQMIIPNKTQIKENIKGGISPQFSILKGAPKKARAELFNMYQQYGKAGRRQSNAIEE